VASGRALPSGRIRRDEHEPPAERVVAFYNKRGTAEQWIKEGKGAIKWTRLSCRTFAANAVRLQLHALAYNLGNFLRTLATPEPIKIPWGEVDSDRHFGRVRLLPPTLEATMQTVADRPEAPTAIRTDLGAIFCLVGTQSIDMADHFAFSCP